MSFLAINVPAQRTDTTIIEKHVVKRKYRCKADIIAAILQQLQAERRQSRQYITIHF
jgi:hypothetical protein